MPFCVWLLAFIMFSRLVHIVAYISISYLFMAEQYSIAWIYYSSFIHSSVDGHLGYFCLFIIVNNAARTIWQFYVLLLRNCPTIFQRSHTILQPLQKCMRVSISSPTLDIVFLYTGLFTWESNYFFANQQCLLIFVLPFHSEHFLN